MKVSRFLVAISAVALACSLAAMADDVRTDYNHQVDFAQYHTYSWSRVQTDNPLWQPRIRQAVDNDLQAKGWQRVDSGGQVSISAVGAVNNQRQYQTFYNGMGGWGWGGFGDEATTTVENQRIGTLVVDMYDTANKQLIWRGVASDTLSDNPEKDESRLQKTTEKMFKDFPPRERSR
jgi:hypothetical protein